MTKVYEADITDFLPDEHNANLGSERGAYMIRQSLQSVGAGRSLVADKHNRIPAGNKTQEAAVDLGFEKVIVVETEGDKLVIVKRTDWDLDDADPNNPARRYAYFDNRSNEVSLTWNVDALKLDLDAGLDLSDMFRDEELIELTDDVSGVVFPEYDESIADDVEYLECPECGHRWPK